MLDSKLGRAWRFVGTAVGFGLFGLGGLICGIVVFPLIRITVPGVDRRRRLSRWLVGHLFALFIRVMALLGVMRYEVTWENEVPRKRGYLIAANHPSLIDVVFLISLFPDADCIVKASLWSNPFMALTLRAADYISNRSPIEALQSCISRLQSGRSLILFPEGTRSVPGMPLRFRAGAAAVAVRAGQPILPVIISCEPSTLTKGEHWASIPPKQVRFHLRVLSPVDLPPEIKKCPNHREATSRANAFMLALFKAELGEEMQEKTHASGHYVVQR